MAAGPIAERNQDATIYVGGLDEKVSDTILWELFVQAGPVVNVHMPKDRLYGKPIRVNKASAHQKNLDVGANIFIGNLDPEVDEKLLYDTFSAFGVILQTPKIMRDPDTGNSKGYAFINFASFEASDAAIEAMNGQYLCNRAITISYAFKKDSKGERHGSAAERLLAAQNPLAHSDRPHQLFADAPPWVGFPRHHPWLASPRLPRGSGSHATSTWGFAHATIAHPSATTAHAWWHASDAATLPTDATVPTRRTAPHHHHLPWACHRPPPPMHQPPFGMMPPPPGGTSTTRPDAASTTFADGSSGDAPRHFLLHLACGHHLHHHHSLVKDHRHHLHQDLIEKPMLPFLATALDGLLRSLMGQIVLKEKLDAADTSSKLMKIDLENPNNIIGKAAFYRPCCQK
ncbi:hypothetical protein MTO96_010138 [Rhipicephalus appendiculatus]